MNATVQKYIGWGVLAIFFIAFAWVLFVLLTTPEEPTVTPDPQKPCVCEEVEKPAELPPTGVSL